MQRECVCNYLKLVWSRFEENKKFSASLEHTRPDRELHLAGNRERAPAKKAFGAADFTRGAPAAA